MDIIRYFWYHCFIFSSIKHFRYRLSYNTPVLCRKIEYRSLIYLQQFCAHPRSGIGLTISKNKHPMLKFIFNMYWNTHETAILTNYLVHILKYKKVFPETVKRIFFISTNIFHLIIFFFKFPYMGLFTKWQKMKSHSPSTKSDPLLLPSMLTYLFRRTLFDMMFLACPFFLCHQPSRRSFLW